MSSSPDKDKTKEEQPAQDSTEDEELLLQAEELAKAFQGIFQKPNEETNFTWEHFFVEHCGILREDALKYEIELIANRMSPCETLLESLSLIVEYGRIPFGDKLKITKTIERQQINKKDEANHMEESKKLLGLEKYNDLEARMILEYAKGDSKWEIDYGIEEFEWGMQELERMVARSTLQNPNVMASYCQGSAAGRREREPTMQLLRSFGYVTFDYTRGKDTATPSVATQSTSSLPVVSDVLFGNVTDEEDDQAQVPTGMYS